MFDAFGHFSELASARALHACELQSDIRHRSHRTDLGITMRILCNFRCYVGVTPCFHQKGCMTLHSECNSRGRSYKFCAPVQSRFYWLNQDRLITQSITGYRVASSLPSRCGLSMQSLDLNDASFGGLFFHNVTVMVLAHLLRQGDALAGGGQQGAEGSKDKAGPLQPPPLRCNTG